MPRMGFILVATLGLIAVSAVLASAQPCLEAEISARRVNIATPLRAFRPKFDPTLMTHRPQIEFDIVRFQPKSSEKSSGERVNFKEEMSGSRVTIPEPKFVHRPEFEADIVDKRTAYKERIVARRIKYREAISWQCPSPEELDR